MTSITIEVDDEMFDALKDSAQETDTSVEQAIIEILELALFEHEEEVINANI